MIILKIEKVVESNPLKQLNLNNELFYLQQVLQFIN